MITMLKGWRGSVEVNGTSYDSIDSFISANNELSSSVHIKLHPTSQKLGKSPLNAKEEPSKKIYRITVKQYMTRPGSPEFDFMTKWNSDNPMPLRTMEGWIEKETPGMVYMHLHGAGQQEICCMRCGKRLTNPISRHYGIGPECMSKVGIIADITDVEGIKEQLVKVEWAGWIIKSAITEKELIKED